VYRVGERPSSERENATRLISRAIMCLIDRKVTGIS